MSPASKANLETQAQVLIAQGVPSALAARTVGMDELLAALDLSQVAVRAQVDLSKVALTYFSVATHIELDWLRSQILQLPRENRWQALARAALRDDLFAVHAELAATILASAHDADDPVASWSAANVQAMRRCSAIIQDASATTAPDFAILSVAMRELRALSRTNVT